MFESRGVRWVMGAISAAALLGAIFTWWLPGGAGSDPQVPAETLAKLGQKPPENWPTLLTGLFDHLSKHQGVRQVLVLQAIPHQPPMVVAAPKDSSHEQEATHWPSPWIAVNAALETGSLERATTVTGRHADFDYRHTLIPIEGTHSHVLLINQGLPAPAWSLSRMLVVGASALVLVWLLITWR